MEAKLICFDYGASRRPRRLTADGIPKIRLIVGSHQHSFYISKDKFAGDFVRRAHDATAISKYIRGRLGRLHACSSDLQVITATS